MTTVSATNAGSAIFTVLKAVLSSKRTDFSNPTCFTVKGVAFVPVSAPKM